MAMKTLPKIVASALTLFLCSIGHGVARNSGAPHPALSGLNGVAQGCHQGQAVGNKHCQPAPPVEIHNEHVVVPNSNQIGGNGGGAQPPKPQQYPVPPNPPEQKTPQPQQYAVPKPIPQGVPSLKPGYQQFPNWTGKRDPDTGYPVPPNPPEQKTPHGPSLGEKHPSGHKMITRHPGRQPLHNLPQFASADAGKDSFCALSGFYRRKHNDVFGNQTEMGMLPSLRNTESLVRDIPAWHEMSSDCLIVVNKRKVGKTSP